MQLASFRSSLNVSSAHIVSNEPTKGSLMTDNLLAQLDALAANLGSGCALVRRLQPELENGILDKLAAAHDAGASWDSLVGLLRRYGFEVGRTALTDHYSGRCVCP